MNNNINAGLTFRAKMDTEQIFINRKKWLNVAKIFEKKTSKYPNDEFVLLGDAKDQDITFYINHANKKLNCDDNIGTIRAIITNILNILPDETVADKLKKLFLIQKKADIMEADDVKFTEKFKLYETTDNKQLENYLASYYALKNNYIKNMLDKDDILKIPNGIYID